MKRIKPRRGWGAPVILLVLIGCSTGCAMSATPLLDQRAGTSVSFEFATPETAIEVITTDAPATLDSRLEARILRDFCRVPPPLLSTRQGVIKGLLDVFIGPIVSLFIDDIERRLKEQLEAYTASYQGESKITFYSGVSPLRTEFSCLRFVRVVADEEGDETAAAESDRRPALDFVASIKITPQADALEIRPLRLYFAEGLAKSGDGAYGVALGLSAAAVWRDGTVGRSARIFEETLLAEDVDLTAGRPFLRYYLDEDSAPALTVPIIPFSSTLGDSDTGGRATFVFSVAEVGSTPTWLTRLVAVFSKAKGDLSGLLTEAAKKKAGFDGE